MNCITLVKCVLQIGLDWASCMSDLSSCEEGGLKHPAAVLDLAISLIFVFLLCAFLGYIFSAHTSLGFFLSYYQSLFYN